MISADKMLDIANKINCNEIMPGIKTFYCAGTGVSDKTCIEYFKKINVIVVARTGKKYKLGEEITEERK